jgi:hypothetical protein
MVLSVRDNDELKAVVIAFTQLPRAVTKDINAATREVLNPIWKSEVESRLRTPMDRVVLGAGVRVKAGNPPVVQAATSTRGVGKTRRLKPADDWQGFEFGADRNKKTTYTRKSKNGGSHQVTRRTARQMPPIKRTGRVAYPALAEVAPRMAARWVQGVVRIVHEAAEGGTT